MKFKENLLSDCLYNDEDEEQIRLLYNAAVSKNGLSHIETACMMLKLGACMLRKKKYGEALEYIRPGYRYIEKELDENSPVNLYGLGLISEALIKEENYEEAIVLCRLLYERAKNVLGRRNKKTLQSLYNIYLLLAKLRLYNDALECGRFFCSEAEKVFGEGWPKALEVMRCNIILLKKLNKYEEAVEYGERCLETHRRYLGMDDNATVAVSDLLKKLRVSFFKRELENNTYKFYW